MPANTWINNYSHFFDISLWQQQKKEHSELKREVEEYQALTVFSFSSGSSKTHLSLESISSSGLASFHWRNQTQKLSTHDDILFLPFFFNQGIRELYNRQQAVRKNNTFLVFNTFKQIWIVFFLKLLIATEIRIKAEGKTVLKCVRTKATKQSWRLRFEHDRGLD